MNIKNSTAAILGAGNIGCSIANGLYASGIFVPDRIYLTRRKTEKLDSYLEKGFRVTSSNLEAVAAAEIVILSVEPHQLDDLLKEISDQLIPDHHLVISVVSGASISDISSQLPKGVSVIRAMPNTAIAIQESMTCIAASDSADESLKTAMAIFDTVGKTLVIREEQMTSATALCACGIAFFLRAIRAASQGGIEIGFHAHDSLAMAAQTAKGAAALLGTMQNHPEFEIDRVTTPKGCTISGLNQMEHGGFSSAMIRGIITSAEKAEKLY